MCARWRLRDRSVPRPYIFVFLLSVHSLGGGGCAFLRHPPLFAWFEYFAVKNSDLESVFIRVNPWLKILLF